MMKLHTAHAFCIRSAILLAVVMLQGCAPVGPDYVKPDIQTPDAWYAAISQQVAQGPESSLQTWWRVFDDPTLDDLIEHARQSNLDLQLAVARMRETRAQLAIATGEKLPTVGASAEYSRSEQSDDGPLEQVAPRGGFDAQNLYNLGVDASWEIDVFGRIRRSIEAAGAQYEASIEEQRDVMVTLFAEVAAAYVDVRMLDQQIDYTNSNIEIQKAALELTQDRYESGVTSKLDVAQARANLANTQAAIPALVIGRNQALNRLAVLLGQNAGSLQAKLSEPKPIPTAKEDIGIGVPADVLRQRPDIRRAERQLAAQTARIGVATADLYPSFTLTGLIGLQSRHQSNLFDSSSKTTSVGIPIQWTLFSGGRIRSNIMVQEERSEQTLLRYENSVLRALEEVENAVVAYNQNQVRRERLHEAVGANQEAVELVLVQYNVGLTDFDNVLGAQTSLFVLQNTLVSTEAQVVLDLIALYKALGGGWDFEAAK